MHKFNLLFLCLLLSSYFGINANTITIPGYVEDMSTLSVSKPDLGLKGWSRIVDTHNINGTDYKVTYSSYTYSYGTKAPSLYCSTQKIGPYGNTQEANDILVTPKIWGTLSFWCKAYSTAATNTIRLFKCTKNADGSFTTGQEIELGEDNKATYTAKTITVPTEFNGEYVGFRIEGCYIDDVSATSAEREEEKSFILSSASNTGGSSLNADQRNSVKLSLKVSLTNTGDLPFNSGDENYELYLHRGSSSAASSSTKIATLKLSEVLEAGETKEMNVNVSFNASTGTGNYYFLYDPDGNYKSLSYITIKEYKPELKIVRDQTAEYQFIPLDFGFSAPADTRTLSLQLKNDGAAPLTDLAYETSDNFTVSGIQEIPAGESIDVTVSLNATTPGWYEDVLTFTGTNVTSQSIKVRGLITDPALWTEDFEEEDFPGNFLVEGDYWKIGSSPEVIATPGNAKWAQNNVKYSYASTQFITPKLEVNEDDEPLQVFIGRIGGRSDYNANIKIKYSADRVNWTEVMSLQDAYSNSPFGSELLSSSSANLFKRLTVNDIPAGEWFIAFEGIYVNIAHITGYRLAQVDHDIMYVSHSIPTEGRINNPYTASLKLKNMNSVPETDYTVTLYAGDEAVATADADEFAVASEKEFTMSYYPHAAGTVTMKAVFQSGEFKYETNPVEVNIGLEVAKEEKQIGTRGSSDFNVPINAYYKHSHTEMIYKESQLGLEPGSQIVSMTFVGYHNNTTSSADVTYSVYLSSDSRDKLTTSGGFKDLSEMTKVKDGSVHFDSQATYSSTIEYYSPLLEIVFDEPFTYEGGNICIAITSDADPTRKDVQFSLISGTSGQSMYGRSDSQATATLTPYTLSSLPVVIIGTQKATGLVTGTVSDKDSAPVEGATIKFTSGEVYYETTTDNEGKYSLEIMQLDRQYKISVSAPGFYYVDSEDMEPRTIPEGETTIDIVLENTVKTLTGRVTDLETSEGLGGVNVVASTENRDATYSTTTTDDGSYTLNILSPEDAEWTILFSHSAYQSQTFTIDGNTDFAELNATLTPIYVKISGTVTDEKDEPVSGATVAFACGSRTEESVTTGEDGKYEKRINVPGEAEWTVSVSAEGFVTQTVVGTLTEDNNIINFSLIPDQVIVSGTVTDITTAEGIAGATVIFVNEDSREIAGVTDSEGHFSLIISEPGTGEWSVTITAPGYLSVSSTESLTVGEIDMNFSLKKDQVIISGTITDKTELTPVSGAVVTFECGDRKEISEPTQEDGKYMVIITSPGSLEWTVTATAENYKEESRSIVLADDSPIHFSLEKDDVGINAIGELNDGWVYFDLNGFRIKDFKNIVPGTYIRVKGSVSQKIIITD